MDRCICDWNHSDCFANKGGICVALTNCDFPGRTDCPFMKDKSEYTFDKRPKTTKFDKYADVDLARMMIG